MKFFYGMTFMFITVVYGGNYPIIFLHGQKGGDEAMPQKCWPAWNGSGHNMPYRSAMDKILTEHYRGYTKGSPLDCHVNTELAPTGGETRKIYNFSYYNPDGSKGIIGCNFRYTPAIKGIPFTGMWWATKWIQYEYVKNATYGTKWAKHFAIFVEKVLKACYGDNWRENPDAKVDVVAHSMGGLVVRAAIKWYALWRAGEGKSEKTDHRWDAK